MKITETTPVKRSFTIELSEDELKMITLIVGDTNTEDIKKKIDNNTWEVKVLGDMNYVSPNGIYNSLKYAIKK